MNTKKQITVILSILLLVSCLAFLSFQLTSCNFSNDDDTDDYKITTAAQAVSAVKNYGRGSFLGTEQRLASNLGFETYYAPVYGSSSATQNDDGSWTVIIKGNMTGYTDEYASESETKNFTITATVISKNEIKLKFEEKK